MSMVRPRGRGGGPQPHAPHPWERHGPPVHSPLGRRACRPSGQATMRGAALRTAGCRPDTPHHCSTTQSGSNASTAPPASRSNASRKSESRRPSASGRLSAKPRPWPLPCVPSAPLPGKKPGACAARGPGGGDQKQAGSKARAPSCRTGRRPFLPSMHTHSALSMHPLTGVPRCNQVASCVLRCKRAARHAARHGVAGDGAEAGRWALPRGAARPCPPRGTCLCSDTVSTRLVVSNASSTASPWWTSTSTYSTRRKADRSRRIDSTCRAGRARAHQTVGQLPLAA